MKKLFFLFCMAVIAASFTRCRTAGNAVASQNILYEFGRNDMDVSDQKTAEATSTKILGIDFARLFNKESGNFNSEGYVGVVKGQIPVVGIIINPTRVQNYALYNLFKSEPSYDFVLYPRFEQETKGIPFIFTTTKAKVTAKLGKIK
jgi:hypothetical protein